jgi:CHAT domain-containing protein
VHAYLGDFYAQSGRVLLARFHLDRAEELATELDDAAILPLALEARAALWLRLGSTANCLREARRILDVDGSLHQRADALLLMGAVFDRECDYQRAKDYYRWAKDLFVKPGQFTLNRSDVLALSRVREQLGRLEFAHGQYGSALDALREAASLAALEDKKQSAALQIERLQIVQWLLAEGRYRPTSSLLAALRSEPQPQLLTAIAGRGPGDARPGRTPAAGHSQVHDSTALSVEQVRLLEGLLHESAAARSTQPGPGEVQSPSAREIIEECRQAMDALESRSHDSSTGTTLAAQLAAARGELATASGLFQKQLETAWKAVDRELDPALAIDSTESFRRLHHDAAVVEARSGRPAAALSILDMGRSRTMLAAASGSRDFWQQLAPEDRRVAAQLDDARTALKQRMTELAAQAAGRPDMVQPLRAVASERQRLEAQWQTFVAKARASQGRGEPAVTRPLDEAQIGELLDLDQALLAWSVGPYETCVVLARRTTAGLTFSTRLLPIRQEELEGLAGAWRAGLVASGLNHDLLGRELYDLLIQPLAGELADVKLLAILPDGPLNSLPFAALPDSRGRYLLERTAVVSIPSLALLTRLRRAGAPVGEGLLVVDVQRFDEVHYVPSVYQVEENADELAGLLPALRLPPLEGTRVEAAGLIKRAGRQAERLSDGDAGEGRVREAAGGKRILHFATHGLADPYDPLLSALVLAPSLADGGDGFLEAAEVMADERLSGADLVTLSACETAVGMTHGSEGVLGLTWAFLAAGNRTVLASLWPVDDVATAFLMDRFYQNRLGQRAGLESPMPKAEALMEAGKWLRNLTLDEATRLAADLSQGANRGRNEPALPVLSTPGTSQAHGPDARPFSHPRYWAAFILIGDPS